MSVRLDRAMELFEDDSLSISMGDRISLLRNALMEDAYRKLKSIGKKRQKGEKIEEDEDHLSRLKCFNVIEKMYISELKMNKITGKSSDNMDKEFLKRIKEEKGSIGDIVRDLKPLDKKDSEAA